MARTFNEIFGESIKSVKELKAVIKEYQDSLIGVNADSEEFKETTEKLSVAQQELTKVTKAGKQEMDAAADSIVGMQKQYKELYDQYKLLSEEQRNSDFGRSMAESLNTLSNKLNESKKEVGNFKDNIGRYSDGVMEAFSKMGLSLGSFQAPFVALTKIVADGGKGIQDSVKGLTESVKGIGASLSSMGGPAKAASSALKSVGGAMKALIANPVGATIMAIVVAFKALSAIAGKVKKAINENEESQMRLKEAMSAFQPIIDKVSNAFDRLGQRVVSFIEFLANTTRKFRELTAAITDFFGFTKGAREQVKEQNEQYQRLAKTENELIKKRREYNELNAEAGSEVQRLREEASETENVAEKKKLLQDAKEKQAEIDQRNIEIAQQELEQLKEEATLTANDEEMNDRLSEAKIKVSNATATAASNMRRFNREIKNAGKSVAGATSGLKNYREEAKKLYEETLESAKSEAQKVTEKYEKEKKLLEKYHYDTTQLTINYNKRMKELKDEEENNRNEMINNAYQANITDRKNSDNLTLAAIKDRVTQLTTQLAQEQNYIIKAQDEYDAFQSSILTSVKQMHLEAFNNYLGTTAQTDEDMLNALAAAQIEWQKSANDAKQEIYQLRDSQAQATVNQLTTFIDQYRFTVGDDRKKLYKAIEDLLKDSKIIPEDEMVEFLRSLNTKEGADVAIQRILQAYRDESIYNLENLFLSLKDADDQRKIEIINDYLSKIQAETDALVAMEELAAERVSEVWESAFDSFDQVTGSVSSLISTISSLTQAEMQNGNLSEKEYKKKEKQLKSLAALQMAVSVASVTASSASAIMDVWKGYASELKVNSETAAAAGPGAAVAKASLDAKSLASAILRTAGIGANAVAQIAAARGQYVSTVNNLQEGGGGSAASVASVEEIESAPFTYTRQVQTLDETDELNRPLWVSVVDINNAQSRVKVIENESRF